MSKLRSALLCFLCLCGTANAGTFVLNDYNVVTIGDFNTSSHVDGRVFVGGDLIGQSKIGIGEHLNSPYSGATLQVAGNVTGSAGISVHGDAEVYQGNGVDNTISTFDNGNKVKVNDNEVQNSTGVTVNGDLKSTASSYKSELENASSDFKSMTTNSTQTYTEGKKTTFTVDDSVGANEYAVFELSDLNSFFSNTANQEAEIIANNIADIAGIIINVGGLSINQASNNSMIGNIFNNFREKILWNFYEATTITLSSNNFMGSLLAPFAAVVARGNVDGSIGAYSIETDREIHLVSNTPSPVEVNEPTTVILFLVAVMALIRRRRSL